MSHFDADFIGDIIGAIIDVLPPKVGAIVLLLLILGLIATVVYFCV